MKTIDIENSVKIEPSFSIICGKQQVQAWRKKGGYILKWTGFEYEKVAPRNEMPSEPYFCETTKKEIEDLFSLLTWNEL